MQPLLIPVGHPDEQLTSSLQGIIIRQYSYGNYRYFFTLYPETGPEVVKGDVTNRYLVVLNSVDGTEAFYLEQNERGDFVKEAEDFWDEPEELSTDKMIMQVEGVHIQTTKSFSRSNLEEETYGYNSDPEPVEDPAYEEVSLRFAHWVTNGGDNLVLPLINAAIKEYYEGL